MEAPLLNAIPANQNDNGNDNNKKQPTTSVINSLQFNAIDQQKNQKRHQHQPMMIDDPSMVGQLPLAHHHQQDQKPCCILPKRVNTLKGQQLSSLHLDLETNTAAASAALQRRSPQLETSLAALSGSPIISKPGSPSFLRQGSARSLRGTCGSDASTKVCSGGSDAASVRSWASVGMGSTDGKKMIVRRVPTSPGELFNIVNPPTPPEEYLYDPESEEGLSEDEDSVYIKPRRQHWSNKFQFVLACVGYSVGLGSVWRFPYLCYKSGGGVFLIPYAIMMIICGVPMLYMELAVGQYTGRGPIGALGHLCPLLKGTGLGSVVISFLMSTYYSVIIAYGIYYFFTSFKAKQPWEDCSHRWNTPSCWMPGKSSANISKPINSQTPAEQFYDKKVLQIGKGIEDFDSLRWELVACLVCAWILVYFAIWKSIKSSAKVRYFTATLPFVLIIVFLAKSLTLEGADKGMRYFFKPKFELLLEAKVWVNAAAQTFNSMGIAFGSMISFASYSKYNNNILHDTLAVSFVNAITSLLVGIFAFATIGNIATEQNTSIKDVLDDGPGLIFVLYPQAIAKMPAAQLWAVLFFFMLICLALNSQFAIVEVVVTSIQDGFPMWIKRNLMCHEILVLIICGVSLICGLPYVTQGGIYFFQLIDHYAASISIMYLAFFEVISVAWFYGVPRLSKNVKTMTGRHPSFYFKFCWLVATPLLIFSIWVFCMIDYESPTYDHGLYRYPTWAIVIGWIISALSILCIPICMCGVFLKAEGDTLLEKLKNSLKSDLCDKCPKCEDFDCDCVIKEEEFEPMLVMHRPDLKGEHTITTMPFYIPLSKVYNTNNSNRLTELNNKFDRQQNQVQLKSTGNNQLVLVPSTAKTDPEETVDVTKNDTSEKIPEDDKSETSVHNVVDVTPTPALTAGSTKVGGEEHNSQCSGEDDSGKDSSDQQNVKALDTKGNSCPDSDENKSTRIEHSSNSDVDTRDSEEVGLLNQIGNVENDLSSTTPPVLNETREEPPKK